MTDDTLPFSRRDIERGLILFRTSNNAHGHTNFVSLTAKVDALPQVAKDELAGMMRNIAAELSPQIARNGEDSAGVTEKARALATAILQHFSAMEDGDGNEAPELPMARDLLAATRSNHAADGVNECVTTTPLIQALSRLAGNRQPDGTSSLINAEDRTTIINGCHDLMVAARQAIAAALPQWQSMDTAPLDGTHCILSLQEDAFIVSVQGFHHRGKWIAVHRDDVQPLAWMPNILLPDDLAPPSFRAPSTTPKGGAE
ncbi:hypothetical protein [Shinella zoogloeoides]|uniref:hypothetical protein n=1 Tax=Shinella zoogloeoides TaxID=352475 RepID=UPI00299D417F|nr:hypothetical protein [Shinella zoogloeoides]WPE19905.1 hypothetical protein ShzoTeo12_10810 [Shinella zoogloeoides]